MAIRVAKTSNADPVAAATELKGDLGGEDLSFLLYFASSTYPQAEVASALKEAFPAARTMGCSTAGELVSGELTNGSLVAMGFGRADLSALDIQVVRDISDPSSLTGALDGFEAFFGADLRSLSLTEHVGIVLMDGVSGAEEEIMDQVGNRSDLFFVGGSAGDDLAFETTHVHADGEAFSGAAVLAVVKPVRGYEIIKTQSFEAMDVKLVATAVDESTRTVKEFDGKPAAEAYAAALGISAENAAEYFMAHPVGLMVGEEPYVRSPQQVVDGAIRFYCAVKEGMELTLLESTDIVGDTQDALSQRVGSGSPATGLINFNCILRTLDLDLKGTSQEYADVFKELPTVGFSTYGEAYLGHINQTATMLLFR